MRIVVLGAGTIGISIADLLCKHGHSITVVDTDADTVRRLNRDLDVRALTGSASQSSVLFQAGVLDADLCLAVTGVDEVNMVAASMAKAMGARRTIARVYASVFRDLSTFDYQRHFQIDRMLSLEHLSATVFAQAIRNPGAPIVEHFARGEIEVRQIRITDNTNRLGQPLAELEMPRGVRIGSISRDQKTWIAGAKDTIEMGDDITLIGRRSDIDDVRSEFRKRDDSRKGIVIAGGGETGYHLARSLDDRHWAVTLMETNEDRCNVLAKNLRHVTVLQADATVRTVLEEERVGTADYFVACTGDDENNIVTGVEAAELGAKSIMVVIERPDYANVVSKLGIDVAVSPRNVMARQVLGYLHTGPVISRSAIGKSGISVFEIEVSEGVPATEHVLANLPLPAQCIIAAVMRENYVHVPGADDRLQSGDTVVALVADDIADQMVAQFNQ